MDKTSKPTPVQVRQGDLLFIPLDGRYRMVPFSVAAFATLQAPKNGRYVLATGEKTGHAHTVSAAEALFGSVYGVGEVVLVGSQPAEVTHEEHEVAPLLPNVPYLVVRQTEYDPRTRRNDVPRSAYE